MWQKARIVHPVDGTASPYPFWVRVGPPIPHADLPYYRTNIRGQCATAVRVELLAEFMERAPRWSYKKWQRGGYALILLILLAGCGTARPRCQGTEHSAYCRATLWTW